VTEVQIKSFGGRHLVKYGDDSWYVRDDEERPGFLMENTSGRDVPEEVIKKVAEFFDSEPEPKMRVFDGD